MSGERTEAPTPRRLSRLREQGQVARSADLGSAAVLLAGFLLLQATASAAAGRVQGLLSGSLAELGAVKGSANPDLLWAQVVLGRATETWLLSIAPLLVGLPLLGVGISLAQGATFSPRVLLGSFDRLNPLQGFRRLLSTQSLVGLLRALGKVLLVGWVVFQALRDSMERLPRIQGSTDPFQMAAFVGEAAMGIGLSAAQVLVILAVADLAYQRWSFTRGARMTKEEVKEETKQQEVNPHVRAEIRGRQRKLALGRRQLLDAAQATVVVTNPTHVAVALRYDRSMPSPRVVAKGMGLIAERIKEIARQAGVPIVENKPLARGLFRSTEIGDDIPLELYQAVAELLAYVFSLPGRRL